ncbi:CDGSH iron-sulfur domain-containing protein [Phenylobacterium sp.]|jgi:3-phenylpropionate/trans-cinnamate dioxygenase ferredoxin subunit|uniref:CDGSH iron-sulfur domain-containing protein n=1 Tax=Phenylobacterium sp. TaxID=1871053 RepID=UPI002E2F6F35|nr:CDGSH iron-sulfur domain-containing protein [Phenylobacterium sp.]HEX4709282.1 CDGSH iron-sulfur domain-containing protein [Phenylobacterium sp.]
MPIKMLFTPNGPIAVSGDLSELKLIDSTGQSIDVSGEKKIFLCRCGGSTTKPFCDGTHSKIAFQAAEAAVRAAG